MVPICSGLFLLKNKAIFVTLDKIAIWGYNGQEVELWSIVTTTAQGGHHGSAIEYGLIAAGISVAIVATVSFTGGNLRHNSDADKKTASAACAARPAGSKENVVIKDWLGYKAEYSCPSWPSIFNPTHVRSHNRR